MRVTYNLRLKGFGQRGNAQHLILGSGCVIWHGLSTVISGCEYGGFKTGGAGEKDCSV